MKTIIKIIQSILKLDISKISHTEKQLLIHLVILRHGNYNTPSNDSLGYAIGENKDYAKNLLSRLKRKGFINVIGRGKSRKIEIILDKVIDRKLLSTFKPKKISGRIYFIILEDSSIER